MADVTIYTSRTCGWAVRNYAALIEKGIQFDTVPARDSDGVKLDKFLTLSPYGKTPVLSFGDTAVFESRLINEFIDEQFSSPSLMPSDPAGRCEARKWIHFCENRLLPTLTEIARANDANTRARAIESFSEDINWLSENVLSRRWKGPYFFGDRFSLVDLVFFTLFRTARDIEITLNIKLPMTDPSIRAWSESVLSRPSLQQAVQIQEDLEF